MMKSTKALGLAWVIGAWAISPVHAEDSTQIKVDSAPSAPPSSDTTITIHHAAPPTPTPAPSTSPSPHPSAAVSYHVVQETDEVTSEVSDDRDAAHESWKKACDSWKKELREDNPGMIVSISCGKPTLSKDPLTFKATESSTGTYRLRVPNEGPGSTR